MQAKYKGTCRKCGGPISVGDEIRWAKGEGASHATCPGSSESGPPVEIPEDAIRLSGGSGYGCRGWEVGQVVRNRDSRIAAGEPEYLYVLQASKRYHREDGMSFGVGDEQGFTYSAVCRAATEEEAAPLQHKETVQRFKAAAQTRLSELVKLFREEGEKPEGWHDPEGDRLFDTQDLYGGGSWWVLGPEYIWYVLNNGADGDAWAHNNVRTGGAGGIGWRLPHTAELADELRDLAGMLHD